MISTLHTFLQMDGRYFVNERTHEKILAIQNRLNGKECIQYEGKKDIIVGDILTIPDTNERFQITRLKSSVDLFDKSILLFDAFYEDLTILHRHSASKPSQITFNIQNATNSVIGTNPIGNYQISIRDLEDLISTKATTPKEFEPLIEALKSINSQDQIPKGFLSRFKKELQENSWLSGPLAQFLLQYFTG
ncbi:hypothetical protein [Megasphaera sp.]|jgi:hypothetical protein|uniref:hypothetical protein n=1 Tax=Megasphaera sp. TaxID=2023260 RepID=UPI002055E7D8|nr:MAG TPA: hypothetical protein [Caudoviricetes sp.]